jgi:hypothetical protein
MEVAYTEENIAGLVNTEMAFGPIKRRIICREIYKYDFRNVSCSESYLTFSIL